MTRKVEEEEGKKKNHIHTGSGGRRRTTTTKKKKDNGDRNTERGASGSEEEEDEEVVVGREEGKLYGQISRSIYSIRVKGILDFLSSLLGVPTKMLDASSNTQYLIVCSNF